MKPRIYLYCGVWHCRTWPPLSVPEHERTGIGFSPLAAYEDWRNA